MVNFIISTITRIWGRGKKINLIDKITSLEKGQESKVLV